MLRLLFPALLALVPLAGAAFAERVIEEGQVSVLDKSKGTILQFEPLKFPDGADDMTMRIVGPSEAKERGGPKYDVILPFGARLPPVDLREFGELVDGVYDFELTGRAGQPTENPQPLDNGREKASTLLYSSFSFSGSFLIEGGQIFVFDQSADDIPEVTKPGEDPKGVDADDGVDGGKLVGEGREVTRSKGEQIEKDGDG